MPVGIEFGDEFDFPGAVPFLEVLFALDCMIYVVMGFVVDQPMHIVLLRKLARFTIAMFDRATTRSFVTPT